MDEILTGTMGKASDQYFFYFHEVLSGPLKKLTLQDLCCLMFYILLSEIKISYAI